MSERPAAAPGESPEHPIGIWEINHVVRTLLEHDLPPVWLVGEISNLSRPRSGHLYFTLKDERAQLRAVMWRSSAARLTIEPADGLEVLCHGRLTVYEPRGSYQYIVQHMRPRGLGRQELALAALRRKLAREGLFAPERKRALPRFPFTIAVIASGSGAVIHDIRQVVARRWPHVRLLLCPVRVQGEGAAAEMVAALGRVARCGAVDAVILARGGGSREDLAAFNDEALARAIAASPVPVVSSVGHAIDVTIADLVADRRAQTPTEAAELLTPEREEVLATLEDARRRARRALRDTIARARERLELLARGHGFAAVRERIHREAERLDQLEARLVRAGRARIDAQRQRLAALASRLEGLSPLGVLARGYSVTTRCGALQPLTDAAQLAPGDRIETRLARGRVISEVIETCPS
ncbi:MAG: exodeoxyribonuclease VII large subunit [Planctomycetota bacterium]|nr:MAG: exodeoxyribonuclease VII large subunit [Planctomycetota bacterium]